MSKGQVEFDLIVYIAVIFTILLFAFIMVKISGNINSGLQGTTINADAKAASSAASNGIANGFNTGIVVAIAILYIGLFITTRQIGTNPMFFFINLFLLIIALGLCAVLGNAFDTATNNPNFVTERAAMPAVVFVGNHLLEFGIGAFAIIMIGLFAKPEGE